MENKSHPLAVYVATTGKSMTAIAIKAECSRMTLYRLMKGEHNATMDLLKRISAATDGEVPASALMGEGSK